MSVKRVKLNAAIWLLLGLFIGVLVGLGINKMRMNEVPEVPVGNPTFIPGRVMNITIDQSQQEELFAQLQKFADKWRYAIRIQPTDLSGIFRVDMWRVDIHVGVYMMASMANYSLHSLTLILHAQRPPSILKRRFKI